MFEKDDISVVRQNWTLKAGSEWRFQRRATYGWRLVADNTDAGLDVVALLFAYVRML